MQAQATARYVRTSAQKAGLVLDLIRGRDVNLALATLKFARKAVARDIEKLLRSAVANVQQQDGFDGDVDRLYVLNCYANQGPSMKRVRPAPMGRAFRVLKRTAHLTVEVAERSVQAVVSEAAQTSLDSMKSPSEKSDKAKKRGRKSSSRRTSDSVRERTVGIKKKSRKG